MSSNSQRARAVGDHALAALDEQELGLARVLREAVELRCGGHRLHDFAIALRRDDRRAFGDEAAQAADVIAVMVRHRDVADRLAGNRGLDARDDFVGAGARAGRFDRDDVVLERDRERVLVLAGDVLNHEHAVGELLDLLVERVGQRRDARVAVRRDVERLVGDRGIDVDLELQPRR